MKSQTIPIDLVDLLPVIDKQLIQLLRSLSVDDWNRQTVAKLWKVKDVAAHLLDTNIRVMSALRDNYQGLNPPEIRSYQDLLNYLNGLNAEWVNAMKRMSPQVLVQFLELTGPPYCAFYKSLDPFADATWSVAWAGDEVSPNWKHIAREYTEKFLHQQQIRDATGKQGIMTKEFFYPFIDTFMLGLPHTFRHVKADKGTVIQVTISSDAGGSWFIALEDTWVLKKDHQGKVAAVVEIDPHAAWKLFSKSLRPADVQDKVKISGNHDLGRQVLEMVSVMA